MSCHVCSIVLSDDAMGLRRGVYQIRVGLSGGFSVTYFLFSCCKVAFDSPVEVVDNNFLQRANINIS